jgi:hypothetical protein
MSPDETQGSGKVASRGFQPMPTYGDGPPGERPGPVESSMGASSWAPEQRTRVTLDVTNTVSYPQK